MREKKNRRRRRKNKSKQRKDLMSCQFGILIQLYIFPNPLIMEPNLTSMICSIHTSRSIKNPQSRSMHPKHKQLNGRCQIHSCHGVIRGLLERSQAPSSPDGANCFSAPSQTEDRRMQSVERGHKSEEKNTGLKKILFYFQFILLQKKSHHS